MTEPVPSESTWTAEVFQNQFLPDGATDVHAIITVTSAGIGRAGQTGGAAEAIIIDCSTSMASPAAKIVAARQAGAAAISEIADGTWFVVIAGTHVARSVYPETGMVQADEGHRAAASDAVSRLTPNGGTAIGQWLSAAYEHFQRAPTTQRHAILLTDGKNEGESPAELRSAIAIVTGKFQCDCRGVGADWVPDELREIASALLGSVEPIADPADTPDNFQQTMRAAMRRGVADAKLKIWSPRGAKLFVVQQVAPFIDNLTNRGTDVAPLITEFPTGAWGDESRAYHLAVRVPARHIGAEQLVARVKIDIGGQIGTQALVTATWSDDAAQTTGINPTVAHYTGQEELSQVIQDGLAAKANGDHDNARAMLGRAVQLATQTGNDDAVQRLSMVVDIEDSSNGRVRLKPDASKLDEVNLNANSTKTSPPKPK